MDFDPDLDARIDDDHRIPASRRAQQAAGDWMTRMVFEQRPEIPDPPASQLEPRVRVAAVTQQFFTRPPRGTSERRRLRRANT